MKKHLSHKKKLLFSKNHFEKLAWKQNFLVCGVDEVGRGPLVGPLVVAAVALPPYTTYRLLKDSKLMTHDEREQAYAWITKHCWYSIVSASHYQIDDMNVYRATVVMMQKALMYLVEHMSHEKERIKFILSDAVPLSLNTNYTNDMTEFAHFPKGEQISTTIAAASIVAKVTRDRMLERYEALFPYYNLGKHKGYATQEHLAAIHQYGPTIFHRTSFLSKIILDSESHEKQSKLF